MRTKDRILTHLYDLAESGKISWEDYGAVRTYLRLFDQRQMREFKKYTVDHLISAANDHASGHTLEKFFNL